MRRDWRDALLEGELEAALHRLNPAADKTMIETALAGVRASVSADLIENNRVFHRLLIEGVKVSFRDAAGMTRTIPLRLIAEDDIKLNHFWPQISMPFEVSAKGFVPTSCSL